MKTYSNSALLILATFLFVIWRAKAGNDSELRKDVQNSLKSIKNFVHKEDAKQKKNFAVKSILKASLADSNDLTSDAPFFVSIDALKVPAKIAHNAFNAIGRFAVDTHDKEKTHFCCSGCGISFEFAEEIATVHSEADFATLTNQNAGFLTKMWPKKKEEGHSVNAFKQRHFFHTRCFRLLVKSACNLCRDAAFESILDDEDTLQLDAEDLAALDDRFERGVFWEAKRLLLLLRRSITMTSADACVKTQLHPQALIKRFELYAPKLGQKDPLDLLLRFLKEFSTKHRFEAQLKAIGEHLAEFNKPWTFETLLQLESQNNNTGRLFRSLAARRMEEVSPPNRLRYVTCILRHLTGNYLNAAAAAIADKKLASLCQTALLLPKNDMPIFAEFLCVAVEVCAVENPWAVIAANFTVPVASVFTEEEILRLLSALISVDKLTEVAFKALILGLKSDSSRVEAYDVTFRTEASAAIAVKAVSFENECASLLALMPRLATAPTAAPFFRKFSDQILNRSADQIRGMLQDSIAHRANDVYWVISKAIPPNLWGRLANENAKFAIENQNYTIFEGIAKEMKSLKLKFVFDNPFGNIVLLKCPKTILEAIVDSMKSAKIKLDAADVKEKILEMIEMMSVNSEYNLTNALKELKEKCAVFKTFLKEQDKKDLESLAKQRIIDINEIKLVS